MITSQQTKKRQLLLRCMFAAKTPSRLGMEFTAFLAVLVRMFSPCSSVCLHLARTPPVFPCNEDVLPVGRLMVTRRDGTRKTRSLATPQAISHRIYFFFLLVEREPIHRVNEPGKSNSKKQWDFRWGANCTKVMLDWSRDP